MNLWSVDWGIRTNYIWYTDICNIYMRRIYLFKKWRRLKKNVRICNVSSCFSFARWWRHVTMSEMTSYGDVKYDVITWRIHESNSFCTCVKRQDYHSHRCLLIFRKSRNFDAFLGLPNIIYNYISFLETAQFRFDV